MRCVRREEWTQMRMLLLFFTVALCVILMNSRNHRVSPAPLQPWCVYFSYIFNLLNLLYLPKFAPLSLSDICLNLNFITILFMILFVFFSQLHIKVQHELAA